MEIGCGGLGFLDGLSSGVALGWAAVTEGERAGAEETVEVGDETCGALAGSPALQAARTMAAGSIQNDFTQPVLLHPRTLSACYLGRSPQI
jgi:hypothetical protein